MLYLADMLIAKTRWKSAGWWLGVALLGLGLGPVWGASYNLVPEADARILGLVSHEKVNFADDILSVYTEAGNVQRSLLRFDLSAVEFGPGVRLGKATLVLSASLAFGGSAGRSTEVYRLTQPWSEANVTWLRADVAKEWMVPGGDFVGKTGAAGAAPFAENTSMPAAGHAVEWDVTELVDLWLEGQVSNHGMMLLSSQGNRLTFPSSENGQVLVRPRLEVVTAAGPPRLRAEFLSGTAQIKLSWRSMNGVVVQTAPTLTAPVTWTDRALAVTQEAERSVVVIPSTFGPQYFRLRAP